MFVYSKFDGYEAGRRLLFKGGGDPGAAAREQEAERQARVKAATEEINRIFNNEVKQSGERMRQYSVRGDGKGNMKISADGTPLLADKTDVTMTPEEYKAKKAQYDAAMAKRQSLFGGWSQKQDQDALQMLASNQSIPGMSAEEVAILREFNPNAWKNEKYDFFVPGDPANARDKLYADQKTAVYDLNKLEVDRQASQAERTNRFGLARNGLMGGSVNIDSNADLNRRTNEGLMKAGGIADQAAADLKTADERTRSNLISLAQSGIDTGTAAQQALKGLEVNSANAASARAGSTIGGLFDDMSQAYLYNQRQQGVNAGRNAYGRQQYGVAPPQVTYQGS